MKKLAAVAATLLATLSLAAQAVGQMADVRVYDRTAGRELPVHWHEGKPYVVGQPGNEYQVTVRNRAGEDLLAVVSVDGVNVVSGETASFGQGGYVVAPRQSTRIAGWRKSLGETAAFYFTSLGDSYAARTDRPGNVGVIGVALFQRAPARYEIPHEPRDRFGRDEPSFRPKAEAGASAQEAPSAKRAQPAPSAPLGTGHGRRESSDARYVEFERRTHAPVETIAIYYDSRRNLVAQGVLPRPSWGRRSPDPFPGRFAPDPWR